MEEKKAGRQEIGQERKQEGKKEKKESGKEGWSPRMRDYELSPYTGLTRDSWLEAGKYLLEGIFRNLKDADAPMVMPRYEWEITYPNGDTPPYKVQAEYFEGLARSFFLAAPLLKAEPDLSLCGYSIREYYKKQILRACTETDPNWVLDLAAMEAVRQPSEPLGGFQQTVETAALVICLWVCREQIWDQYGQEERNTIAAFISDYAHGLTIPQNWRLFNMLDLAFLHMEGYPIDEDIMRDHGQAILEYYVGEGWYRDGHAFDYYSCWAFNLYTAIWNHWYGYEKEPYLASRFEDASNTLMETYQDFFDKDGWTNMWGRSNIYRNGATAAFAANFLMKNPTMDPGLARRISSGSLLQFLERDDWRYEGIPVLGFYGPFAPMVQSYSCAESPFWLAKSFLCLYLPQDHPFWTATENNGSWEQLGDRGLKVTSLNGPALCVSNHAANGTTLLRTGKVVKAVGDEHGMWNYAKLVYSTKLPWEAAPCPEVEAQQYVLYDEMFGKYCKGNALFWQGEKEGVLYRRGCMEYSDRRELHWTNAIHLADIARPCGILRVDKMRIFQKPFTLTLGAFGFPDNGTERIHKEKDGAKALILKGRDHMGRKKQMAMTILAGWQALEVKESVGTNPDSEKSLIPYAIVKRDKQYGYEPYILVSQVISREDWEDFAEEDLFPIGKMEYTDKENCGGYGPVKLELRDGLTYRIDFDKMEGRLML